MTETSLHPLGSSSTAHLLRMVVRHGCEASYLPRLLGAVTMSLLRQPAMVFERLRYGTRIARQRIEPTPLFIIGHWRSGTTHLQNVLNQDPQFGGVTLLQAAMPLDFMTLGDKLAGLMRRKLPNKRLMDNVSVTIDAPWEEEMALAGYSPLSFYNVSFFPRDITRIFDEAVMFANGDNSLVRRWKSDYLHFLKKVQLAQPGRRMLLKNPANTARIAVLKSLFPDARFIHIRRNPYKVFASTVHLYLKAQQAWGFHTPDRKAIVRHVMASYPALMNAYFAQRHLLGSGELSEICFGDLQQAPLETLATVYDELGLDGFNAAVPRFRRYLDRLHGYRKNALPLPVAECDEVAQRWGDLFARLGYAT